MASADFVIGEGDLSSPLTVTLSDVNGPIDLTGDTVTFHMVDRETGATVINHSAVPNVDQMANKGVVTYTWLSGNTVTPGEYAGEFLVLIGGTIPQTFPNTSSKILITITAKLI